MKLLKQGIFSLLATALMLLSTGLLANELGISYALGEFENSYQTKQVQLNIEHEISDSFYAKGLLIARESQHPSIDNKNEGFFGIGLQKRLNPATLKVDLLLSEDYWRVNPRMKAPVGNSYSIEAGLLHRDKYKRHEKTTLLHAGVGKKLANYELSANYYVGNLTRRSVNDYLLFSVSRDY